jgi:hypothetical protein
VPTRKQLLKAAELARQSGLCRWPLQKTRSVPGKLKASTSATESER